MKVPATFWVVAKAARQRFATAFWSSYYGAYLRLHPACRAIGQLRVTGRMKWDLHPSGELYIADGVRINSGSLVNAVGGHRRTIIAVHDHARLVIGKGTGLSGCTVVCQHQVEIGQNVFIGGGAFIVDSDLHPLRAEDRTPHNHREVRRAPVCIKDRVFVGADVLILKGVTVGAEAVLGAGSVVARDVPSGEVWVGNPAKRVTTMGTPVSFSDTRP
jgi:carbonic anhydrase/acetyltransferase-like protein (isoleucine patch superfamily)